MRFLWYQNHSRYGGYQPQPTASADNPYWLPLSILDIIKTEGNNCFIIHWTNSSFLASTYNVRFQSLSQLFLFLRFSQFFLFHVISKRLLFHLRRPHCVLWVLVFNYFFDDLPRGDLLGRSKPGGRHVFASSLTASNTKRANLTWLPLEIEHRGHTWLPVTLSVLDMIIV